MKLHRNVNHFDLLCLVHEPGFSVKGLGHTEKSLKIACPEQTFYTHRGILMNFSRNVHHYEKLCRAHETGL
jgi:hypothetical protein